MAKNILILVLVLSIFAQVNVLAAQETYTCKNEKVLEQLIPELFEKENFTISRGICIMSLMQILGVDDTTATFYANSDYYMPVFLDMDEDRYDGYIIISKFSGVSVGEQRNEHDTIHYFCSKRDVTVKECLTFMLRCLKDSNEVVWDNVMADSAEIGLLHKNELDTLVADDLLSNKDFCILLERMLNMNRYLYWSTDEPPAEYAKSMQIDKTDSIMYIDWNKQ